LRILSTLKSNRGLTAASFIDKNCKTEKWKIDFGLLWIQRVWTVQSPKFSEDNSEPLQDVNVPNVTIEIVGSHSAKTEQFAINSLFEVPSRFKLSLDLVWQCSMLRSRGVEEAKCNFLLQLVAEVIVHNWLSRPASQLCLSPASFHRRRKHILLNSFQKSSPLISMIL
jgi:hypothetical protein